ncbi:hypothetical protein VTI28DRAFT_3541 [Corynascus sepedonium]
MPETSTSSTASAAAKEPLEVDLERGVAPESHVNTTIHSLAWNGITVTIRDRKTKLPKTILNNVDGVVEAGEILAVMGPSGCGKTTLLHRLAGRPLPSSSASSSGTLLLNGQPAAQQPSSTASAGAVTRLVEQHDYALLGALTVHETLAFAARLSGSGLAPGSPEKKRSAETQALRTEALIDAFGLRAQADTLVGTTGLLGKKDAGLSGGQKRRLSVACQLVRAGVPRVLILDEPTSGLDSAAGWEVIQFLKEVARREKLIVIASIHQPSTSTFNLFDKLLLMSRGKTHYFGPTGAVAAYYASIGHSLPVHVNPAEFLLEMVNTDFEEDQEAATQRLDKLQHAWATSSGARELSGALAAAQEKGSGGASIELDAIERGPGLLRVVLTLMHRSFVKSYRDVVVYGVRLAMYTGLAIMIGTVWLRLDATQESIIPFMNAIFYGSAFMSFMACAYSPAYIEDYMLFIKEKRNGLYGATAMTVSNFLIGIPYLFLFSVVFSAISYWLTNLQPTAQAFFTWVLWVFLDLVAAESLVVLVASVFPSLVPSLALVAFANGLWMSVDGFMVPPTLLNAFYKYGFHFWDYQKYVFENMMINEFAARVYTCAGAGGETGEGSCQCMWQTDLADQCLIRGQGVLDQYGYKPGHMGKDVGIMMAIILGYRVAGWVVLKLKK